MEIPIKVYLSDGNKLITLLFEVKCDYSAWKGDRENPPGSEFDFTIEGAFVKRLDGESHYIENLSEQLAPYIEQANEQGDYIQEYYLKNRG